MKKITINIMLMIFISSLTALIMAPSHVSIFSAFGLGFIGIQVVVITGIPIILSVLPTLSFYLIKRKLWRGVFVTMWIAWSLTAMIFIISQVALQHYLKQGTQPLN